MGLQASVARHERLGARRHGQLVELVAVLPANIQNLGEAFGGNQRGRREPPLDDGVGSHRRAMHDVGNVGELQANCFAGGDDATDRVGLAQYLSRAHGAANRIARNDIGEGFADIYP